MNEYEKSELEGRAFFEVLYPNYVKDFSKDKYSWWDVSGYTVSNEIADVPYVAELKKRGFEHDYHPTVMLQVDKYENLKNYTLQSGIKTFYVCFYSDRTLVFNIDKIDPMKVVKESKMLPVNTAEDNGYKLKEVMYLPITDAKILSRGYKTLKK
ncbi:hypothetical protein [Mucilaginibacter psychrotolerans]|uniref:Uncharacterized protein n=1 Tax=Mucilaginibacter psychrotolerans TaxID=1524096 RepID=A0A4Y8S7N9_9SPHI|nr:hypothetical protein [Mucilaginibacter psychrotolerans]TFF34404.1 hypothetical protein E2R66_22275 [Mucilaginibacter psychrotolerans]